MKKRGGWLLNLVTFSQQRSVLFGDCSYNKILTSNKEKVGMRGSGGANFKNLTTFSQISGCMVLMAGVKVLIENLIQSTLY